MIVGPRLIVLGRQGAGKGTQCQLLSGYLGVEHISTGDLLRAEVAATTDIGQVAKQFLDSGALVPDRLVTKLVAERLGRRRAATKGYLLDGYPRTLAQGCSLFQALDHPVDLAIEIRVSAEVALPRLAARRVCRECGAISIALEGDAASGDAAFNGHHQRAMCAQCGGRVERRDDDTHEAIARRFALYDAQTGPLMVWLADRVAFVSVDGVGTPSQVHRRVRKAIDDLMTSLDGHSRNRLVDAG